MFGNIWPCKKDNSCRPEISSLQLKGYELRPKFHPKIHMYTVNVHDAKKAQLDLKVSPAHKKHRINHTVSKDLIKISVGNGEDSRQYFVGIAKQNGEPEAPLQSLSLSNHTMFPAFNPKTLNYFVIVSPDVNTKNFEELVNAKARSEYAKLSFKTDDKNGVILIAVTNRKEKTKTLYRIRIITDEGINYQQPMSFYNSKDNLDDIHTVDTSVAPPQTEPEKILPSHFSEHQEIFSEHQNDKEKSFACPHGTCSLEFRNEKNLWNHQIQKHAVALCKICYGCGFSMEDFKQHNSIVKGCLKNNTNDSQPTKMETITEYNDGDEYKVQLILMRINRLLLEHDTEANDKNNTKHEIKQIIEQENISLRKFQGIAQNLDVDDPIVEEFLALTTPKPTKTFKFENIIPAKKEPRFSEIQNTLDELQNRLESHSYLLPNTPTATTPRQEPLAGTKQPDTPLQMHISEKIRDLEDLNLRIEKDIETLGISNRKTNALPEKSVFVAGVDTSVTTDFNSALEDSMRALERLQLDLERVKKQQI